MENNTQNETEKKVGFSSVMRAIFVHNIGLKILAIVLAAALVVLAVAL